jgi:hypothetical protein
VTPEPLNTILVVALLALIALFALAWFALLGGVVLFIFSAAGYRRAGAREDLTPERRESAEAAFRRGMWGLAGCAVIVVCYVIRQWVGTYFYDEIAQGLVTYSRTWWIVMPTTFLWWASVPVGIAGTVVTFMSGLRLRRLMKKAAPALASTD